MKISQTHFKAIIKIVISSLISSFLGYCIYNGYQQSIVPSKYEIAAAKLGFNGYKKNNQIISAASQHEAILQQFHILGYLKPQEIWQALEYLKIANLEQTFQQIYSDLLKSRANSQIDFFDAKILRKNFLQNTDLDQQDAIDLMIYLSQKSYNRKIGQERNELPISQLSKEDQDKLVASAKVLGLIEREDPQEKEYDIAWIAGASRVGLLARVIDFKNILSLNPGLIIKHGTQILAGQRELWANLDGINPKNLEKLNRAFKNGISIDSLDISITTGDNSDRNQEGLDYLKNLAQQYKIKLDDDLPFIQYATKDKCPPGRFPNRLYANYAKGETARLTETLMAKDILSKYHVDENHSITIIDTPSDNYKRPTTASTAKDAAEKLIDEIMKKDSSYSNSKNFKIMLVSNNPYIERQTISVQREVDNAIKHHLLDKKGYTIRVEGVGFGFKQDVSTISSEFAALITERRKDYAQLNQEAGLSLKRSMSDLLYHAHNDSTISAGSYPKFVEANDKNIVNKLSGWFNDIFDRYLP